MAISQFKTMWNTFSVCLSRSVESVVESALHNVSHCHKFSVCLSRSAGSAIEAISLALHSRTSVWHIHWSLVFIEINGHIALRQCVISTLRLRWQLIAFPTFSRPVCFSVQNKTDYCSFIYYLQQPASFWTEKQTGGQKVRKPLSYHRSVNVDMTRII